MRSAGPCVWPGSSGTEAARAGTGPTGRSGHVGGTVAAELDPDPADQPAQVDGGDAVVEPQLVGSHAPVAHPAVSSSGVRPPAATTAAGVAVEDEAPTPGAGGVADRGQVGPAEWPPAAPLTPPQEPGRPPAPLDPHPVVRRVLRERADPPLVVERHLAVLLVRPEQLVVEDDRLGAVAPQHAEAHPAAPEVLVDRDQHPAGGGAPAGDRLVAGRRRASQAGHVRDVEEGQADQGERLGDRRLKSASRARPEAPRPEATRYHREVPVPPAVLPAVCKPLAVV